jgi:hypothetical protein
LDEGKIETGKTKGKQLSSGCKTLLFYDYGGLYFGDYHQ